MVGVLQVMVYAGAIMVLVSFRHHVSQPMPRWNGSAAYGGRSARCSALLLARPAGASGIQGDLPADPVAATELFGSPEMLGQEFVHRIRAAFRDRLGRCLLVAIIGAVVLAKRER